ncbi:MAG: Gfo/Idh/MocA family oxidoreductase [Lunatimonas sp.]|uniref:Gfo/Idh/MocA family protein n=1 Tax=Lunatimonas sp. TaxID=2060141 RepID=UPI00263AE671|nr:Gfo/Idh/MocA family oxidoreductase [Lunatimonas sp.]MCC5939523.1 Gfo/Idh/MocA family oxidoreductase [Lunatimonas sp.]
MTPPIDRRKFIGKAMLAGAGLSMSQHFEAFTKPYSQKNEKRVGIIGLDTSHSIAFTKAFNASDAAADLGGYKVVAAYPQGSKDIKSSVDRIPGYIKEIQELGVEVVDSIQALLDKVDFVLLETNDGRLHLEQALEVFKAGKRMFIDKPISASLVDAIAIFKASEKYGLPTFSSSSLRYMENVIAVNKGKIGKVLGADAYSPATLEPTHPDLFWYGIHGVETLYAVMGKGCKTVQRTFHPDSEVVVGTWEDGRIGTFRGLRSGKTGYGGTAFGSEGIIDLGPYGGYRPLLVEIAQFFNTGKPPIDPQETIELFAFMEAASESRRKKGQAIAIADVMTKAQKAADKISL